jgi:hypothetical protein
MKLIFWTFIFLFSAISHAQDERSLRKLFLERPTSTLYSSPSHHIKWEVTSPAYHLDLDGDEQSEGLFFRKTDGIDWVVIKDARGKELFVHKLMPLGELGRPYKMRLVSVSRDINVLIIYYFEGVIPSLRSYAMTSLYLLTFQRTTKTFLGAYYFPGIYEEKIEFPQRYSKREYKIRILDIDRDGQKEIEVSFGHINRILFYRGLGKWQY